MELTARHRELLGYIWHKGALSRSELAELSKMRRNTVGELVAELLAWHIVRESDAVRATAGRPRRPLELDRESRFVVGLALMPGQVSAVMVDLAGEVVGETMVHFPNPGDDLLLHAEELLAALVGPRIIGVGVSVTGFVDTSARVLLFGSSRPGQRSVGIAGLENAASHRPLVIDNDMRALAARWMLSEGRESKEDTLLVKIADGLLGAALLIEGRPAPGCVSSAHELGHTRFFVDTEPCYCGHRGCLERICSSSFLRMAGDGDSGTLLERARASRNDDQRLGLMLRYLARGLANVANFSRPHRLVLASELATCQPFYERLLAAVRAELLPEIRERLTIETWERPAAADATTGAWLALASLYREGW